MKETVALSDELTLEPVGVEFASEIAEVVFADVVVAIVVLGAVVVVAVAMLVGDETVE